MGVVVVVDGTNHQAIPRGGEYSLLCEERDVLDDFQPMTMGDFINGPSPARTFPVTNLAEGRVTCMRCIARASS